MSKKIHLLFLTQLVFFTAPCLSNSSKDPLANCTVVPFEMLGLTPGSDITELNLNWYSDGSENNKKTSVRLFDSAGKFISITYGKTGTASAGKLYHRVTLKNLKAGAKYKYSVSSDSVNCSDMYNYSTPAAGAFRFAVVADPQLTTGSQDSESIYADKSTAEGWAQTVSKIAAANASLIVSAGDQVDKIAYGDENEYANLFAPAALRSIPFAPTVGNHDRHCPFIYHFNLPNEQDAPAKCTGNGQATVEKAGNYFYLYNNVLFIALNTSAYPGSKKNAASYITVFENTIKAAKTANAGKYDWLVVHHHKSTASVAIHVADSDIQYYVEAGFEKLMTTHGVDLVLAGHDHIYVRSHLMKQDSIDDFSVRSVDGKGTIYLTLTTAGGLKYYSPSVAVINNPPLSLFKQSQNKMPEYTIIDVDGVKMSIKTLGINGSVVDSWSF